MMTHIWRLNVWKKHIDTNGKNYKAGLRMHFEKEIPIEVHSFLSHFSKWLRREYHFPLRVNVYVKKSRYIKAMDGELVVGTMWKPNDNKSSPYIRLAVGDYYDLVRERGVEGAEMAILDTFAHELTHYFQHINNVNLTRIGEERQAIKYADCILDEYYASCSTTVRGNGYPIDP